MGVPQSRLVINGSLVNVRDHPYVAKLILLTNDDHITMRCSGTIISNKWILTAAHAFGSKIVGVKVRVGISDVSERGQVTDGESFHCHPLYKGDVSTDICLLKTTDPLKFDDTVRAANLPTSDDNKFDVARVTGWGRVAKNAKYTSVELRTTIMNVEFEDRPKEMCLYPPSESIYPCFGDSGSGIIGKREDGSDVVIGVAVISDCETEICGPRVFPNLGWITSTMDQHHSLGK